jgi:hypothetical protein
MLYMLGVFSPRSSFTGQRKLAIFLGGRPTDLMCLNSIRLMRLKVILTKGRRATEVGFSGVVATLLWIESLSGLPVTVAFPLESVLEKLQLIMKTFVITQGSDPMYQRGKHNLFVGKVVVRVGMEIEQHIQYLSVTTTK